jgi:hypothetical protein
MITRRKKSLSNEVKLEEMVKTVPKAVPTELRPKRIMWKKISGGVYKHYDGQKYRRGQTFPAAIDEIPKAFRDTVVPVDPTALATAEELPLEVIKIQYVKEEAPEESGNFRVFDSNGKAMSEGVLTEAEADDLIKALEG